MIKIKYCSDLHLEFPYNDLSFIKKIEPANILVLAGDIVSAVFLQEHRTDKSSRVVQKKIEKLITDLFPKFEKVIWILGNHEHYSGIYDDTPFIIEKFLEKHKCYNVSVLSNGIMSYKDLTIIGTSLWTNYNNFDPLAMYHASRSMNDYKYIKRYYDNKIVNIIPEFLLGEFNKNLKFIETNLNKNGKNLVITHHAPSLRCINYYHSDRVLDGAYASDLSEFILNNSCINAWISGHTHIQNEFEIGTTKLLSNCRGYSRHENELVQSFSLNKEIIL